EDSINDKPHEIYIKLDDLVSQHEATLKKEWLQPIETPTEAYYREFDNFKDTYLCNFGVVERAESHPILLDYPCFQMTRNLA
ncbi:44321_t:CDS:2, partial [Gigaspora margarita]